MWTILHRPLILLCVVSLSASLLHLYGADENVGGGAGTQASIDKELGTRPSTTTMPLTRASTTRRIPTERGSSDVFRFLGMSYKEQSEIAKSQLMIQANVQISTQPIYVGDEVEIKAKLKNISNGKLSLYRPSWQIAGDLEFEIEKRPDTGRILLRGPESRDVPGEALAANFIVLAPGGLSEDVSIRRIPFAPGKFTARVRYDNYYRIATNSRMAPSTRAATSPAADSITQFFGTVWGSDEFVVVDDISPARKAAYSKARELILSPQTNLVAASKALLAIASEKHIFAARFIVDIWAETKDPKVRQVAFDCWMKLLKLGTAYDSFPKILDLLESGLTPDETRAALLDALEKVDCGNIDGKAYSIVFVVGQGEYVLPDELVARFQKAVLGLIASDSPLLIEKAKKISAKFERTIKRTTTKGTTTNPDQH